MRSGLFSKKPSATSSVPAAALPPSTGPSAPPRRGMIAFFGSFLFPPKDHSPQPIASTPSPQSSTQVPKPQVVLPSAGTAPPAISQHITTVGPRAPLFLWEKALRALPEEDQRLLDAGDVKGQDVLDGLMEVAKKQKDIFIQKRSKLTWDGRVVILRDVVDKVLASVERRKEIGDTTYGALAWVGFGLIFQALEDGGEHADMGVVMIALEKISALLNYCAVYEGLFCRSGEESTENLQNLLIDIYGSVLRCVSTMIGFYKRETSDGIATGLLHCEELHIRLGALESKASGVHDAAGQKMTGWSAQQSATGESKKLRYILQQLDGSIMRTDLGITAFYDDLEDSDAVKILQWVSSTPYQQHHKYAKHGRVERTGEWLLGSNSFKEWRESSTSTVLWLRGMLGAGKTKLTSSVVDCLLNDLTTRTNTEGFAYFYSDRNECQRRDPAFILRAILKQLSNKTHTHSLHNSVVREYKLREEDAGTGSLSHLTIKECRKLITQLLSVYPHSTIVIDGLDECGLQNQETLLESLQEIVMSVYSVVKIFLSGRSNLGIAACFKLIPTLIIEMDNAEDIGRFVEMSVRQGAKDWKALSGRDDETLEQLIHSTLTTKANGCFLWVDFHIKLLSQMTPKSDVKGRLQSRKLPTSLEAIYNEIFRERIGVEQENDKRLAHLAMRWMMCSARPLSPDELVKASNVGLQANSSNADIDTILRVCHDFVVIDREADVIRFTHSSVHEFLERLGWGSIQTNAIAAEACLSVLVNVLHPLSSVIPHTPFLSYSVYYWQHHAQRCNGGEDARKVQIQLKSFLGTLETPAQPFLNWLTFVENKPHQQYEPGISWRPDLKANLEADPPSILPTICYFGLHGILRDYLNSAQGSHANKRNKLSLSMLSLASGSGNEESVRTLIDCGAVVNQPGGTYGYALHYASALGQESTVRVLLEKGADVHRMGWNGKSALAAAALEGQDGVARILLENGATRHVDSAFVMAAGRENLTMLRTLAENGADLSHKGQTMFDALDNAIAERITNNVRFLISILESDVNEDREFSAIGSHIVRSAVTTGSMEILLTIFEMLPDADLDLPSKESGKTALQIALECGSDVMADFLISRGAKIQQLKNLLIGQLQWARNEAWFPELLAFLGTRTSLEDPLLTPEDVLQVQSFLNKITRLPEHLVNSILDLGEYWVYTECSREEDLRVEQYHAQLPYVQLPIQNCLDSPVRKIVFRLRSHDQGWTSGEETSRGTYHGSYTWFEAGVTQDTDPEDIASVTAKRREIQRNLTAVRTATTHTVTWDLHDGKSADWLQNLVTGQVLGVYPRALYGGWVNHVERVDIRVYCAWV